MKKLLFLLYMILSSAAFCQNNTATGPAVEMADQLRADGKIWIVVAVLLIVLLGILMYVILLDRKISKIEKEVKLQKD